MSQLQITRPELPNSAQQIRNAYVLPDLLDEENTGDNTITQYLKLFGDTSLNFSQPIVYLRPSIMWTSAIKEEQDVRALFIELSERWKAATLCESSISAITTHPDYQKIIGLGNAAIPLILQDLIHGPNHWFAALRAITRQDPTGSEEAGDMKALTQAWLRWGRLHGYIL